MHRSSINYQFRFILIGDSTVGKSSLLQCFTDGKLSSTLEPTVGVDFFFRNIMLSDGTVIKLRLWDTAGQEKFKSITRSYYRNAVGALLIFDITNHESFEHILDWYEDAMRHTMCQPAVFILCGQKLDLESKRQVSKMEAEQLAERLGMPYIETSALTDTNVETAFKLLAEAVYSQLKAGAFRNLSSSGEWDGVKQGFRVTPPTGRNDEEPMSSCC